MNITTVLMPEPELNPGEVPATENLEGPCHNMVVHCQGSLITVEDADWVLINEKGEALHSLPTFRVMLGADEDGVRLHLWKQGMDLKGAPSMSIKIAGWDHGQIAEVSRQNHYSVDPGGNSDGSVRGIPKRILHLGDVGEEDRGAQGREAGGKTPFGRWIDHIRQEYRRIRGDVR